MPAGVITDTRARRSRARPALAIGGAVVAAGLLWVMLDFTRSPSTVPRLTIDNPSAIDVEVAVSSAGELATLDLGHVPGGERHVIRDVLDQGTRWAFTINSPAGQLVRVEVDRTTLADDDWTVRLPSDLAERDELRRSSS